MRGMLGLERKRNPKTDLCALGQWGLAWFPGLFIHCCLLRADCVDTALNAAPLTGEAVSARIGFPGAHVEAGDRSLKNKHVGGQLGGNKEQRSGGARIITHTLYICKTVYLELLNIKETY